MKVISLWQPWATLMAAGYKRIETRSWYPSSLKHGQLVAIHAAKRWTADEQDICYENMDFKAHLTMAANRGLWSFDSPPRGCVVAVARFDVALPTRDLEDRISETERGFGNYEWGRYGWVFSEVRPLKPIPLRGQQGIFDWMPAQDELQYLEPRNPAKALVLP